MKWLQTFVLVFKVPELRNKILFILGVFGIFRLGASIPIPGIDTEQLREFFAGNQFFGLLNIFSGGTLSNLSVMMLGLGPYITSVIVLQLLTMIFPRLKEMYEEEGEQGRQKFNQYGRLLTVPLAALQGYGLVTLFTRQGILAPLAPFELFGVLSVVTAGTLFLMWLGELISEKGVGNGISLLIFAGIVAQVPQAIRQSILTSTSADIPSLVLFGILVLIIIAAVVVVNEARRNIPVSYAKRVRGFRIFGGTSTYLPLNLNPAGVIPIIFALSIMLFPSMIGSFLAGAQSTIVSSFARVLESLTRDPWIYGIAYFTLVVLFTFFYTAVTFNPDTVASNLQKQGGFIPGIRPGPPTSRYLTHILNRTLLVGALFLGTIAVLPSILQGFVTIDSFVFIVGGTSVLIMVSVVLETLRQINAQLGMRQYEGL